MRFSMRADSVCESEGDVGSDSECGPAREWTVECELLARRLPHGLVNNEARVGATLRRPADRLGVQGVCI